MSSLLHETLSLTFICPSENVEDDEHIEAVNNSKLLEQGNNVQMEHCPDTLDEVEEDDEDKSIHLEGIEVE